jgi:hypothetical protein
MKKILFIGLLLFAINLSAQTDSRIYDIINAVSAKRIEKDITTLTQSWSV